MKNKLHGAGAQSRGDAERGAWGVDGVASDVAAHQARARQAGARQAGGREELPRDEHFMERALELAQRGVALASPNPMVGAVVVRDGKIVGEGFHTYEGVKHAEAKALEAAGGRARGSTLYVNLEPCCHTGRTLPCSRAVIAAGIRRVVVGMRDPNPLVAGGGVRALKRAGIEVRMGVREGPARKLNEAFARWILTRKPMVTMKSALTLDGQIAGPRAGAGRGGVSVREPSRVNAAAGARGASTTWITSEESRQEVQKLRNASDALLSGIGTVLADDPMLTDRTGLPRRQPLLRVILDSRLRLPVDSKLVASAKGDLLVFTAKALESREARELRARGVQVVQVAGHAKRGRGAESGQHGTKRSGGASGGLDLRRVVAELGRRTILSVLLEGGSRLNGAALAAGIVDKMILFYAPKVFGSDGAPWIIAPRRGRRREGGRQGAGSEDLKLPMLREVDVRRFGPDICVEGYLRDVYGDH